MLEVVFLFSLLVLSSAYPDGAPELGCYTSCPFHDHYMPQHSNVSFILEFVPKSQMKDFYVPGEPVKLVLRSLYPDRVKLSGYLVTMRSSSGLTGGEFQALEQDSKVMKDCGVTQTEPSLNRTSVEFLYIPPLDMTLDTIQFRAIAVHNFSVFWDTVLSPPLLMKPDTTIDEIQKILDQFVEMASLYDFSNIEKGLLNLQTTTPSPPPPPPPSPPSKPRRPSKSGSRSRSKSKSKIL